VSSLPSMTRIPVRLEHDAIADCVIEVRFCPTSGSTSDLLPGLLYREFKADYPEIAKTAEAQLPKQVREINQALKAAPIVLLKGARGHVGIADEAIQLRYSRPYPGWPVIKLQAQKLFKALLDTGLIKELSRVSALYTNVLTAGRDQFDLTSLEVGLSLPGDLARRGPGTSIRFEVEGETSISVVQIQTGATAVFNQGSAHEEKLTGLMLRIDTISTEKIDDLNALMLSLEHVHSDEKRVFFSLLTDGTTKALGPIWS